MDELIAGISWLAKAGREGAKQLEAVVDDSPQLDADLEEAICWLTDIANGNEI